MSLRDDASRVLAELEEKGRLRGHRVIRGVPSPSAELATAGVVHNFSSNDYLGLAGDVRLQEAAISAMRTSGVGSTASRLIMTHEEHEALEVELASWLGTERVQLFNSGYAANVGMLSTLAGAEDVVFSDQLNHASLIDGCRLSRARVCVYQHADLVDLERQLREAEGRRRFIVSESVFSMDGDIADVVGLGDLARRHGAVLILDEAHAVGVLGPQGRGIAAARGVVPDLLVGTLGKSFGCYGAFVAGSSGPVDWLWNRARSLVFSTGIPPLISAAARAALKIIHSPEGDSLRAAVSGNAAHLAGELGVRHQSHIIPWLIGDDVTAVEASQRLLKNGLFAQAIRPPTVPEGTARLRLAIGVHGRPAIDMLIQQLRALATPSTIGF
jgi:8-amino-7-oxononanoate synthase